MSIPDSSLFESLSSPHQQLPSVAECAVHLELLDAFFTLKQKCLASKHLSRNLNLQPTFVWGKDRQCRRQAAWGCFLALAVVRFLAWWEAFPCVLRANTNQPTPSPITADALPPLDVLMVWHAYLLAPARYKEFCENTDHSEMLNMPFPWAAVHEALNSFDGTYTLSSKAAAAFVRHVHQEHNLFSLLSQPKPKNSFLSGLGASYLKAARVSASGVRSEESRHLKKPSTTAEEFLQIAEIGSPSHPLENAYYNYKSSIAWPLKAVQRQESFSAKMVEHGWLRSPAAALTLRRAVNRYRNFLKLFKMHSDVMLVPTLHIDIVWHTHQCSSALYKGATIDICGRFINHDDTIEGRELSGGWEMTKKLYKDAFQEDYDVCLCWYCEAWLEEKEKGENGKEVKKEEEKARLDNDDDAAAERAAERVARHVALEQARKKGKLSPLPKVEQ